MPPDLRAATLMRNNIRALLAARKENQAALASWLRHSRSWINKFLNGERQVQLKDLDRIADFFGIATYQLFQPGISPITERRVQERRKRKDRRIGHAFRELERTREGLVAAKATRGLPVPAISGKQGATTPEVAHGTRSVSADSPDAAAKLRAAIDRALIDLGTAAADTESDRPAPSARPRQTSRRRVAD